VTPNPGALPCAGPAPRLPSGRTQRRAAPLGEPRESVVTRRPRSRNRVTGRKDGHLFLRSEPMNMHPSDALYALAQENRNG
jgi:hypothetical protein